MASALHDVQTKRTSQRERTLGRTDEVRNNAGGYVFAVSDKDRLERFLILGTDKGTYYVGEKDLTNQNVKFLSDLIAKDEKMVRESVVDVSVNARAYKNDPALFALAALMVFGKDKAATVAIVPSVARTATHLYTYAQFVDNLGGWGRAKRQSVSNWFTQQDRDALAYQAVKYRQRNGWTLRDLMRLSHPQGVDSTVGNFILGRGVEEGVAIIDGFKAASAAKTEAELLEVLGQFKNLPWEALPTDLLKSKAVWKTLFYNNQLNGQALVRNITRLARLDAFSDLKFAADYAARLTNEEMLRKTRLHPVNLLLASVTYENGQTPRNGYYREKNWKTAGVIKDALNDAFHLSFKTIEPANKRTFIGVDVSGSMSGSAMGIDLSCAQVSGAIAMTIARTEPAYEIRGFTMAGGGYYGTTGLTDLGISAKSSLSEAMRKVQRNNFGGTDAALPIQYALQHGIEIDTFVTITDNETWGGSAKPTQALKEYRDKTGIPARLAVLGVAATNFTIADPTDSGQMDFVGFDSNAPRALADFSAGRI